MCRDGILKNQPNSTTLFTSSLHLAPFCQLYALCLAVTHCVHKDVEGSVEWVGLDMLWMLCTESELCCGWLQLHSYWAWQIGLSCIQNLSCGAHEQCWVCMACWSVSYVVNCYCCWTWQTWVALYAEGCGVSSAECHADVCERRVMH